MTTQEDLELCDDGRRGLTESDFLAYACTAHDAQKKVRRSACVRRDANAKRLLARLACRGRSV